MHDSIPVAGKEVAVETAAARMAYAATCEWRLYLFSFSFLANTPFFKKDREKSQTLIWQLMFNNRRKIEIAHQQRRDQIGRSFVLGHDHSIIESK